MPVFMSPAILWGLLTALILAGIYLFRRQSKTVKVSSLMFFNLTRHAAEGGRRLTTPQTPFILFLELAVLVLLVLAAANPRAISGEKLVPVVLILDDSLSMGVNEPDSPREAALKYLEETFFSRSVYCFTLIRAGLQPEIIGRHEMTGNEARWLISNWRCNSPTADLHRALHYVSESFSPEVHTFVVTDHAAGREQTGKSRWLAFGKAMNNLAITSVSRYALGASDRCFVEFTSFASEPLRLQAEILNQVSGETLERLDEIMQPRATRRVRFLVKDTAAKIMIKITNDLLAFDNTAWLLPVRPALIEVELRLQSEYLRQVVERAVSASGLARLVASSAQLLLTDSKSVASGDRLWQLCFHVASQPAAIAGVIAVDKGHPLVAGLPPVKAAWAVDSTYIAKGQPLMSAGPISLLSVNGDPGQRLLLDFNLTPEYSDLQNSPVWPVLFWNLLNWRQQNNPGPVAANFRSGSNIKIGLPDDSYNAALFDTKGKKIEDASVWHNQAVFQCSYPGIYQVKTETASWAVAINLCAPAESDLTRAVHLTPPSMPLSQEAMRKFTDVRWWFILPALILMALHQWLVTRRRYSDASY